MPHCVRKVARRSSRRERTDGPIVGVEAAIDRGPDELDALLVPSNYPRVNLSLERGVDPRVNLSLERGVEVREERTHLVPALTVPLRSDRWERRVQ